MSIEPVAAADLSDGIERNYCSAQRAASWLARARRPRGAKCPDIRRRTPVLLSPGGLRGAPSGAPRTLRSYKIWVTRGGAFLVKKLIYRGPNSSLPPYIIVSVG